jgi:hypothetical protein
LSSSEYSGASLSTRMGSACPLHMHCSTKPGHNIRPSQPLCMHTTSQHRRASASGRPQERPSAMARVDEHKGKRQPHACQDCTHAVHSCTPECRAAAVALSAKALCSTQQRLKLLVVRGRGAPAAAEESCCGRRAPSSPRQPAARSAAPTGTQPRFQGTITRAALLERLLTDLQHVEKVVKLAHLRVGCEAV